MKIYELAGIDNGLTVLSDFGIQAKRCKSCSLVLSKWELDVASKIVINKRADISCTYDGFVIVTERFVSLLGEIQECEFTLVANSPGYYVLSPHKIVYYDNGDDRLEYGRCCSKCSLHQFIMGADPISISDKDAIQKRDIVRTDLEFGEDDEKCPVILCGSEIAEILKNKKNQIRGLRLSEI